MSALSDILGDDFLGDAIPGKSGRHFVECNNETCSFDICAILRENPHFLSILMHTSPAVNCNAVEPTIPARASVRSIQEQKQAYSVPVENKQQLPAKIAAHKKDSEISAIQRPQEQGAVRNEREDEPKAESGLALAGANKVGSLGSDPIASLLITFL